jgi:hypothetical protein
MSLARRIRAVLDQAAEPMPGYKVAARAGITTREFNRRAAALVEAGEIERTRKNLGGRSGYWYSLNMRQISEVRLEVALEEIRSGQRVELTIPAHEISGRLEFLRMLKEKTVFRDHAAVNLMIADYEHCQRLARREC